MSSIINFVHVRHIFFANPKNEKKAIAPFAAIFFKKDSIKANESNYFKYWSARKTSQVIALKIIVLHKTDLKILDQNEIKRDSVLWKLYWWGSHKDHALLNYLKSFPALQDIKDKNGQSRIIKGQGYILGIESKRKPTDITPKYVDLGSKGFSQKYGPLDLKNLKKGPSEVYRKGVEEVFFGNRLLIARGVGTKGIVARFEQKEFCFRHSIQGIKINGFTELDYKVLLAILWSKITTYYYWLTSSSWGIWHFAIDLKELLTLPIVIPENLKLKETIGDLVDKLRSGKFSEGNLFSNNDENLNNLETELNSLVFDLYSLSPGQRDLILDMCDVNMDYSYKTVKSSALCPIKRELTINSGDLKHLDKIQPHRFSLESYVKTFINSWETQLPKELKLSWQIVHDNSWPLIATIFSIVKENENLFLESDKSNWKFVLQKLTLSLHSPYNSERIFIDGIVRVVTETEIIIVKLNERRLWTNSLAREDAEATIVQAINLQESKAR